MDLTWVVAGSVFLVGTGYAVVSRAHRFRVVRWSLLAASLFALATRDLFRPRDRAAAETGDPASESTGGRASDRANPRGRDRANARTGDRTAGEAGSPRSPLFARLRQRFARWRD